MRCILSLFILFIFSISVTVAQQTTVIDSLNEKLSDNNIDDTSKVDVYLGLAEQYYRSNPDTAIYFCHKAESVADKTGFIKGKANSYSWLGYLHNQINNYQTALSYLKQTLVLQDEINDLSGKSTTYNNIGSLYRKQGKIDSAIYYFNEGLKLRQAEGDLKQLANSLNNLGAAYHDKGEVPIALEYYLSSLRIKEHLGDKPQVASSKYNIAYIYNSQGDTSKALNYFLEAKKINEEIGDQAALAMTLVNIGNIYSKAGKYEKAINYTKESLRINNKINSAYGQANSMYNLGFIYKDQGKLDSALVYIEHSLDLLKKFGIKSGVAACHIGISQIKFEKDELKEALINAEKGLAVAREIDNIEKIKTAAELLSKIHEANKNGTKALEMHKLFIVMRDTLENIEAQKSIIEQNMQYEFDKEAALTKAKHEKELAISQAEKEQQQIILWTSVIGLMLVVIFVIILISRLKVTRKQKHLIEEKNKENELLLGEIHHRVKNNLQVISSLLSLQEKTLTDESAKKAILEGKERVRSMGLIHKMLYKNDNFSGIEMQNYVQKLVNGLLDSFGKSVNDIKLDLDFKKYRLDVDTAIPMGLILNELIINSLKYAYDKTDQPRLKLALSESDKSLILEVEDNGGGEVEKVENSDSFGAKLVKSLVRQLNGEILLVKHEGLYYKITIKDYKLV
ncbi:MAG: tetratricopeptide repeat protein [Crocinitomicaceae bacterium]